MEFSIQAYDVKSQDHDFPKKLQDTDTQMTSSTVSSLSSPVDSGVQLLDSESEITSVMSVSGYNCDIENIPTDSNKISNKYNISDKILIHQEQVKEEKRDIEKPLIEEVKVMTKSDIINQNVCDEYKKISSSVPSYFDDRKFDTASSPKSEHQQFSDEIFEMEHPIKNAENTDIMNVSLTSYELLDYTLQNKNLTVENPDMHVSLSEEVNENLKLTLNTESTEAQPTLPIQAVTEEIPISDNKNEEQIVFRRQRKKKSKSDTPKKRVSFHEDILNSTKIDDIHINHGFITHEPEVSLSFFQRGFIRKPDVVKGRYSWAAEGDAPYYEKPSTERQVKSDIYINHHKHSSTSSSSTGSSTSSIDEEDSDETFVKKEPSLKSKPKSSCLKKTKHPKKYIDTNIVQEEIAIKKKKSETNLLDSNIFGSLKNILNFSSSVPLAERGVPEGQEDLSVYSTSHDGSNRKSLGDLKLRCFETIEIPPPAVNKLNEAKNNLKLTKSEGFYPTYPNVQQNLPGNIILCDSNVYEHKGISYSYEYDKFQKTFEKKQTPKSSTVYQMILKEFNFFRRRAREEQRTDPEDDFEIISNNASTPVQNIENSEIEQVEEPRTTDTKPSATTPSNTSLTKSSKIDWSDNETISDLVEPQNPRHLSSPKRKINKTNHYSISNSFKSNLSDRSEDTEIAKSLPCLKSSNSKTSLINRFLKNVTLKKMVDAKIQYRQKNSRRVVNLYVKGVKQVPKCDEIDQYLEKEIAVGRNNVKNYMDSLDKKMVVQFRKDIFRNRLEKLHRVFHVRSAYTTDGESRPLLVILTDITLYIVSSKPTGTLTNHFVLPYTDLDTILIGPQGQTIHFSNHDKEMQCLVSTGCTNLTSDLVGQLEIAMRKDINKPRLPAVRQLTMRDMVNLRRSICRTTSVHKDEEYFYYSIVNVQDCTSDLDPTPLGPNKEGPLMFKTSETESTRWETAYFILKAGVLYMLSSPSQRVPMRVFPLINGSCQGARRVPNSARPHTFQVIVEGKSLLLAAPNEYVASEWLQELVHAASGMYSHQREKNPTQSCSLLMTSEHILTVREAFPIMLNSLLTTRSLHEPIKGTQALSCASIVNLTAFRLPSAEQSWCILEFACREVHEYSGDWILYFSTNVELEKFISTLENLWHYNNETGDSFPLNTIPETDPLSKKCVDVYTSLLGTWPSISSTVLLQFL
ncbi:uncharacterized protein LOC130441444 [Diorhabda sublineata]|uniref:uncharacterized protein LOC130441444 n=1 Tax=Diorhabda sublineata TaxID=1163346 RepID=UPI0024E0A23D|nr:uncharacterized protein LOC130441444 [Diorhabda sublineata]